MSVGGRPTKLDDNMRDAAEYYIENHLEFDDPVPTAVGLACALKVAESTIYRWASLDEEQGEGGFSETLAHVQTVQHKKLVGGALTNDLNATIAKLMLSNHGYSDKQEQTLQGPGGGPIEHDHAWTIEVIEPDGD